MSEAIASKEERLVAYNANIAAADKDPSLSPETGKPRTRIRRCLLKPASRGQGSVAVS